VSLSVTRAKKLSSKVATSHVA